MSIRLELVSTGDELLQGRTLNSHPRIVAEYLGPLGLLPARVVTVGDQVEAIAEAVKEALRTAAVVLVGGGLGPTQDDVTREGVARAVGRSLRLDGKAAEQIRQRTAVPGQVLPAMAERQALVVEGAEVLENRVGVAPGQRLTVTENKTVFLLPGPPAEFEAILGDHVVPWLKRRFGELTPEKQRVLMTSGLPELEVARRLERAGIPPAECRVAFRAAPGRVEVVFSAPRGRETVLDECVRTACRVLGDAVYAEERITLSEKVGRLLRERGLTLSVAESCTGGLLGGRITDVSGSSGYFVGGITAYSNEVKVRELGVPREMLERHGAVSPQVAGRMAEGVRTRLGSDMGVAVTGIAGPTGGTPDKPVGLVWFAVADERGTVTLRRLFGGDRSRVREGAVNTALDLVRRRLLGLAPEPETPKVEG